MKKYFWRAMCAALLALTSVIYAQTTAGSIYGAVTDSTGASIPNATVVITDVDTGVKQTTTTNGHGDYTFTTVQPSDYTVTISAPGFKSETQTGVTVAANTNVHVPSTLVAGGENEVVEVRAGVTLVDTREAQIGDTIDQAKVQDLPTINRDSYSLLTTVTGVQAVGLDTRTGSRDGTTFSVNGFPADTPSFYLDGAYNNAFKANGGNKAPSPDSLDQFRIITSNFDAEFGRSPGGVVSLITQSGTNKYHGKLYEYIRNDAFDAKGFFNTTKLAFRQNQFGGTFGGYVPKTRDKLFFFVSYERLIYKTTDTVNSIVTPTAAERTGDFSASKAGTKPTKLPAAVQCGTTAAPKICAAALDPVAQNLLKFLPVADAVTGATPQLNAARRVNNHAGLGRLDYHGIRNHALYGTFFNSVGTTIDPNAGGNQGLGIPGALPQYAGMIEDENQMNAILADDWTISSRLVNSIRGYYTQNRYVIKNSIERTYTELGSGTPFGGPIHSVPRYAVTGFFTLGSTGAGPSDIGQLSFGLIDTANWQLGRHAIKFGASWNSNKYAEDGNATAQGAFNFTNATTGSAFADFLIGSANTFNQSSSVVHRTRQQNPATFFQDDWQITRRLNLNLGVRYEIFPAWLGDNTTGSFEFGRQSTVIPTAPPGILFAGDKGIPDGTIATSYNRVAPRVGLAWDVYGNGRTSLRAGYGIFYNQFPENPIGGLVQMPYAISQTTNTTPNLVCPYGGTPPSCSGAITPFPFTFSKSSTRFYTNTDIQSVRAGEHSNPYANEFNLSVEQQLTNGTALRISYVGATYMKQYLTLDINAPVFFPGAATAQNATSCALNNRRPYQPFRQGGVSNTTACKYNGAAAGGYSDAQNQAFQYSSISALLPINNQSYNSLQVTLRGKIRNLNFNSSYVWGKALNYTGPTVDNNDIRKNRGVANIDIRNRFTFSAVYKLPEVKHWGFVGKQVLSGWSLNDVTVAQSGSPFTVNANVDVNRDGYNTDRVNVVGDPYLHYKSNVDKVYKGYLNGNSFQQPCGAVVDPTCTNPYGNEQRNMLTNPVNFISNISVFKAFPIYEELKLQFRAEAFNVFNYTHLNTVRNNLTVFPTAVNAFQGADDPRRLQFALKLMF